MSICYVNGSFEDKSKAMISIQDRGFNFADGVYEVMSFYGTNVINIERHLKRLEKSLEGLKINFPYTNIKSLELILKKIIKLNYLDNGFLYLQITRGSSHRNHLFPKAISPNIVIFTFNVKHDEKLTSNGVNILLSDDIRWGRCDIKSISLLPNVLEKQKAFENNFYESWQKRGDYITEGSTSNAFIVNKNNEIQTHPSNNYILGGVTRDTVIQIAKLNKLIVKEEPFSLKELQECNEAFLTSTTAKILPVVKVDNVSVNNGKPGIVTNKLIKKYNHFIDCEINESN